MVQERLDDLLGTHHNRQADDDAPTTQLKRMRADLGDPVGHLVDSRSAPIREIPNNPPSGSIRRLKAWPIMLQLFQGPRPEPQRPRGDMRVALSAALILNLSHPTLATADPGGSSLFAGPIIAREVLTAPRPARYYLGRSSFSASCSS